MEGMNADGVDAGVALRRFGAVLILEMAWLAFLVWMAVRGG